MAGADGTSFVTFEYGASSLGNRWGVKSEVECISEVISVFSFTGALRVEEVIDAAVLIFEVILRQLEIGEAATVGNDCHTEGEQDRCKNGDCERDHFCRGRLGGLILSQEVGDGVFSEPGEVVISGVEREQEQLLYVRC